MSSGGVGVKHLRRSQLFLAIRRLSEILGRPSKENSTYFKNALVFRARKLRIQACKKLHIPVDGVLTWDMLTWGDGEFEEALKSIREDVNAVKDVVKSRRKALLTEAVAMIEGELNV